MKNEVVFYGKVNGDKYETILYKTHLEPRMTTEWKKQIIAKCESLGAVDVRCVEYIGNQKPDFTKALSK